MPPLLPGEGTVTPTGGTVSTQDGRVSINFPPGAVTSDTFVSIEPAEPLGPAPEGFKLGETTFSVTTSPAVAEFGTLIQICVQYSAADLFAIGGDPLLLTIAYYDAVAGDWVVLDTDVNTVTGFACAWTSHVSVWSILTESGGGGGGLPLGAWIGIGVGGFLVLLLVYWWGIRPRRY